MISAEEIRIEESQIRPPLMVLTTTRVRPNSQVPAAASLRDLSPYGVNLSGTQLLIGFVSALSAVALLLWAFLQLWLFEP
jgi:hypothetical protein